MPGRMELALGAIAEQGGPYWNKKVLAITDLSKAQLKSLSAEKLNELEEQSKNLRGDRERIPVKGRVVILVDDGLATGATMIAAIECLKRQDPKKIIVAVPVGSKQAVEAIGQLVDEVIVGHIPEDLWSVGMWFQDFTQVSDDEVKELLCVPPGISPEGEDLEIEIFDKDARLPGRLTLTDGRTLSHTLIVKGYGLAEVTATGGDTQVGKIGKSVQPPRSDVTRLQQEIRRLVRTLGIAGIIFCAIIAIIFALTRNDWPGGILAGLAAAMAMIPEEFPVILTIFFAMGAGASFFLVDIES